jgi:putative sterol carrier protein
LTDIPNEGTLLVLGVIPLESFSPTVAQAFRRNVTKVLSQAPTHVRQGLRGHYLFTIDGSPSFVVELSAQKALSGEFGFETQCAEARSAQLETCDGETLIDAPRVRVSELESLARVNVITDSTTLERLLLGTLRAKKAFLIGKVKIEGDLPGFLQLIQFLKGQGVNPPGVNPPGAILKNAPAQPQ